MKKVSDEIVACTRCPRLIRHCQSMAIKKKREFRDHTYWGKPVPGFGDVRARVWILGLAPAAHGANRTGRMFTGDSSGNWLYKALHRVGFASQAHSTGRDDGMVLHDIFISAVARCAPPDNKPTLEEIANCERFLDLEFERLKANTLLALGAIAFTSALKLLERKGAPLPRPRPKFGHGKIYQIGKFRLVASYHPSRQNTQTRKLTEKMWNEIFEGLKDHASGESDTVASRGSNRLDKPSALRS